MPDISRSLFARLIFPLTQRRTTITLALLASSILLPSSRACGQLVAAEQKGLPANGVYTGSDIENVNLQNGNLHISIPIAAAKQRGGNTFTWQLVYDLPAWTKRWIPNDLCGGQCTNTGYYIAQRNLGVRSGWRLTDPTDWEIAYTQVDNVTCPIPRQMPTLDPPYFRDEYYTYTVYSNWVVTDPEGSAHPLPLRAEGIPAVENRPNSCLPATVRGPTLDGSGIFYDAPKNLITLKDGTRFSPGQGGTDRNGNKWSATADTLNRQIVTTNDGPSFTGPNGAPIMGPQYTTYTVVNSNGSPEVYRANYQLVTLHPNICSATASGSAPLPQFTCNEEVEQDRMLSSLVLPNGKSYVFHYSDNTPGEIASIDLPTGATISYTYRDFYQLQVYQKGLQPNFAGGRAVTTRTVTVNGIPSLWRYELGDGGTGGARVTDPMNNVTVHTFTPISISVGTPLMRTSSGLYEVQADYYQGASTLLRSVKTDYIGEFDPTNDTVANVRKIRETTILDDGQQSKIETDYETFSYPCSDCGTGPGIATRLNPQVVREYAYGAGAPGALLRETITHYLGDQPYVDRNIVDKPSLVITYDGSGSLISKTLFEYDVYSRPTQPFQTSGAIQHDADFGTGFLTRGNLTAVSKWRNTDNSYLVTTHQYDDAGNIISTLDANQSPTFYDYSDLWGNTACATSGQTKAFLTKVTNAKGHVSQMQINSCTGTVASTTDPNAQTTTVSYGLMNRQIQVHNPDGALKTYCYSDDINGGCYSTSDLSLTETDPMGVKRKTLFDGLGRPVESQLAPGTSETVYVDQQYDGLGRAYKVWNPYRAGDTQYFTTSLYDGIGRPHQLVHPDGSSASWTYSGNTTTSSDEAGKKRRTQTDALGRLTTVWEDPAGLSYETDYTYDGANNLRQVVQHGGTGDTARTRQFTYDSLSELITSYNPETGTICYGTTNLGTPTVANCAPGYDANGNLTAKTDARGLTTIFNYDVLNRLTRKYSSDGTVDSRFTYDSANGLYGVSSPCTYGIGRLCNSDHFAVAGNFFNYDQMGRTVSTLYATGAPSNTAYSAGVSAVYDLAGNLSQLTYPDGRVVNQTPDLAGRLATVADGNGTTYIGGGAISPNIQYSAAGAPRQFAYGNGVAETVTFNNRLQVQGITATMPTGGAGTTILSKQYSFAPGTSNNGNISSIWDALSGITQTFTYDALNRLATGVRSDNLYNQTYSMDSFGNMHVVDNLHTNVDVTSNALNQMLVNQGFFGGTGQYHYDAAGNIVFTGTSDVGGHAYTYDAESMITQVDNGATASYTYNGMGERATKMSGNKWTNYVYFGGQPMAELTSAGVWTDYIYANGKKIASLPSMENVIHVAGTGTAPDYVSYTTPVPSLGYTFQAGDKLYVREKQVGSLDGGILLFGSNGSNIAGVPDQNGMAVDDDAVMGQWHTRVIPLDALAGSTLSALWFGGGSGARGQSGTYDVWLADMSVISAADGSVHPIFNNTAGVAISQVNGAGVTPSQAAVASVTADATAAHYYVDDHLGTASLELSAGGWPVWKGEFAPYGAELNTQATANHYKFTGKERDAESGNDYFGARYYASNMGRWMSPDWSAKQEPVPYAKLGYPQSLNLYSYVLNNPLSRADADGHDGCGDGMDSNGFGGCAAFGNHPLDKNDAKVLGGVTALFLAPVALEAAAVGVRSSIGFISRTAMSAYLGISVLGTKAAQSLIASRDAVSSSLNAIKDAAASGEVSLSAPTASRLGSAINAVTNSFTNSDINGAMKQSATGIQAGGDHVQELQATGNSLVNLGKSLSGALQNPNLSDQTRALYQNAVKAIQPAVDQINKLNH